MNVLLIYPSFHPLNFFNDRIITKLVGAKHTCAPLGLMTVASLLPEDWNPKVLDLNVESLVPEHAFWADLVMISSMINQQQESLRLIEYFKKFRIPVVLGGPDPSSQPEFYHSADYLVLDEAELSLKPFLDDFLNEKPKKIYRSSEKCDMSLSPLPRFDLVNSGDYLSMPIQVSRGCPFQCEFCVIIELYGRVPRLKTSQQIIDELNTIYEMGFRGNIDIVDDNFIGNKKLAKEILVALVRWNREHDYCFSFSTEATINLGDDSELLDLLHQANFKYIYIGIESVQREVLLGTKKFQNTSRSLEKRVESIQKSGIIVYTGIILGMDHETRKGIEETYEFINKVPIVFGGVYFLTVLKGTSLEKRLHIENRLISNHTVLNPSDPLDEILSGGLNFVTSRKRKDVYKDFLWMMEKMYSLPNYLDRAYRLALLLRKAPQQRVGIKGVFKKLSIIWRILKLTHSNLEFSILFWKYALKLFVQKPSNLEHFVLLSVKFFHFEKVKHNFSVLIRKRINEEVKSDGPLKETSLSP